jgi:hypothetical protein
MVEVLMMQEPIAKKQEIRAELILLHRVQLQYFLS